MTLDLFRRLALALERHGRIAIAAVLALSFLAVVVSALDAIHSGGIDLRPKVLGARALLAGLNPYLEDTFRWTAGTPAGFVDPETLSYPGLSRVSYPPSLLLIYSPFVGLPYKVQRLLWWALEWAAIGGTVGVLAASIPDRRTRLAFIVLAVPAFCGSWFWRFHVERGQYYVFLALLISLDLFALRAVGRRPGWLGLPIGVAVALRPSYVVLLPLLWLPGERRAAVLGTAAAAMMLAATLPLAGVDEWRSYFQNVSTIAQHVAGIGHKLFSLRLPAPLGSSTFVEGYDFAEWNMLSPRSRNLTICGILQHRSCLALSTAFAGLVSLGAAGAMVWLRAVRAPRDVVLLTLVVTPVLLDYAVPVRWSYADVLLLPLLSFLVPAAVMRPTPLMVGLLVLALLSCLPMLESSATALLRQGLFLGAAAALAATLLRGHQSSG